MVAVPATALPALYEAWCRELGRGHRAWHTHIGEPPGTWETQSSPLPNPAWAPDYQHVLARGGEVS